VLRAHNLWPIMSFELIPLALERSSVKLRGVIELHYGLWMHWPLVSELALGCSAVEVPEKG